VDGFTIFDLGENRYRICAVIHYEKQRLYIRGVMTPAEYDRNAWRKRYKLIPAWQALQSAVPLAHIETRLIEAYEIEHDLRLG
jgi:HigB_toxin, RelE-like toxic component of a toxin-antitoxin system